MAHLVQCSGERGWNDSSLTKPHPGVVSLQRSLSYHDFIPRKPSGPGLPAYKTMFDKLFGMKRADSGLAPTATQRMRVTSGSSMAEMAAEMLAAPTALAQLTPDEAREVVSFMKPHKIAEGITFIKQGDTKDTDFMLLVIDGEVTVESIVVSRTEPITVSVLGPGSLIGEMGLVDGEPRSASCTAVTTLRAAILTRAALNDLLDQNPRTAAKLLMAISLRIAERMRDSSDKLRMYAQLTQAMQQEIDRLMPT
jgi:CRP/FNR family cyclic AMP-dependent transcriptional regulator